MKVNINDFTVVEMSPDDVAASEHYYSNAIRLWMILHDESKTYRAKANIAVEPWRPLTNEDLMCMIKRQWQIFFIEDNSTKELVGLATVKKTADKDTFELMNVVVDPQYRGNGLGKMLCQTAIDWCKGNYVTINVSVYNPKAAGLYHALGFKDTYVTMHRQKEQK